MIVKSIPSEFSKLGCVPLVLGPSLKKREAERNPSHVYREYGNIVPIITHPFGPSFLPRVC